MPHIDREAPDSRSERQRPKYKYALALNVDTGTLAWLKSVVDDWYCAPLEGPRGATAEQLLEHLGKGNVYDSVAQAWQAAIDAAQPEDTVLVCGSFHTVAHVMEVIDAGRIGGE